MGSTDNAAANTAKTVSNGSQSTPAKATPANNGTSYGHAAGGEFDMSPAPATGLTGSVGIGGANAPDDIFQVSQALTENGLMTAPQTTADNTLFKGIIGAQERMDSTLKRDGLINPDGPTQQTYDKLRGQGFVKAPTPAKSVPQPLAENPASHTDAPGTHKVMPVGGGNSADNAKLLERHNAAARKQARQDATRQQDQAEHQATQARIQARKSAKVQRDVAKLDAQKQHKQQQQAVKAVKKLTKAVHERLAATPQQNPAPDAAHPALPKERGKQTGHLIPSPPHQGESQGTDKGEVVKMREDASPQPPAISDETFQSNQRLAGELAKRNGVGDLPKFTTDAINTDGAKAIPEFVDLLEQVHENDPKQAQALLAQTLQGIAPEHQRTLKNAYARNLSVGTDDGDGRQQLSDADTNGLSLEQTITDGDEYETLSMSNQNDPDQVELAQAAQSTPPPSQRTLPPIPADKKDWFKGKEKEWQDFYDATGKLPNMSKTEQAAYMHIFGREGGMAQDKRGSAASGIIPKTADVYLGKGDLKHVKPGTPPSSLSVEDRAKIYRHYMDDQFSAIGGHKVLEQIGDEKGAIALADGMFRLGNTSAAKGIQEAMNSIDSKVTVDKVFGSKSLGAYKRLLSNPKTRGQLLEAIADKFTKQTGGEKERWDALRP